jgi:hypothetical protein
MIRKLLTADVAARLGVTPSRVKQLIDEGTLASELVGERNPVHVFDVLDVEALAGGRASSKLDRTHAADRRRAMR